MTRDDSTTGGGRVVAVDVLRGLVLLVLVPDTLGGFSFYRMAASHPDDPVWTALASQFTHVEWSGAALWDLVMPLFVFLVGVSMAMSYRRRKSGGATDREMLGGAALRTATLVVLGLLVQMTFTSLLDEALLLAVLATGLPVSAIARRLAGRPAAAARGPSPAAWTLVVLVCALAWMALDVRKLGNYQLNQILILIGLAYLPAFFMMRYRDAVKAAAAAAIVAAYAIAFALYAPQASPAAADGPWAAIGSHWRSGANVAAAFDQWLLNLLPRAEPYAGNPHDYHTLQFVPMIALMLAGAIAGGRIAEETGREGLPLRFAAAGFAGLALSAVLVAAGFPLVKSLWTPSWTVFGASVCLILLGAALRLFDAGRRAGLAMPLVVLGANSILLYVLAIGERWRVLSLWQRVVPAEWMAVSWRPVLESVLVLASFWLLAAILYRWRVFVRI
jgi:predicted acyltransferase